MTIHRNSIRDHLDRLEVGESCLIETSPERYIQIMRDVTNRRRYPDYWGPRAFSTSVYTLVSNARVGDVRLALRIERKA